MTEKDSSQMDEFEKKAVKMVKNYVMMIEGIESRENIPSQDREEMYHFLRNFKDGYSMANELLELVTAYDKKRNQLTKTEQEKRSMIEKIISFGSPKFN